MNIRNQRRVMLGLALGMMLSACSYSIKIPFIPEPTPEPTPECSVECDAASSDKDSRDKDPLDTADEDSPGLGSTVLKFLRGRP